MPTTRSTFVPALYGREFRVSSNGLHSGSPNDYRDYIGADLTAEQRLALVLALLRHPVDRGETSVEDVVEGVNALIDTIPSHSFRIDREVEWAEGGERPFSRDVVKDDYRLVADESDARYVIQVTDVTAPRVLLEGDLAGARVRVVRDTPEPAIGGKYKALVGFEGVVDSGGVDGDGDLRIIDASGTPRFAHASAVRVIDDPEKRETEQAQVDLDAKREALRPGDYVRLDRLERAPGCEGGIFGVDQGGFSVGDVVRVTGNSAEDGEIDVVNADDRHGFVAIAAVTPVDAPAPGPEVTPWDAQQSTEHVANIRRHIDRLRVDGQAPVRVRLRDDLAGGVLRHLTITTADPTKEPTGYTLDGLPVEIFTKDEHPTMLWNVVAEPPTPKVADLLVAEGSNSTDERLDKIIAGLDNIAHLLTLGLRR